MSRYFGYMIILFTDGTTERVGGNKHAVQDGVLIVRTDSSYGSARDVRYFPLANVKSYHWEGE